MTVRTGLHVLNLAKEGLLGINNLSFSVTLGTGNGGGSRFGSGSVTLGTLIL